MGTWLLFGLKTASALKRASSGGHFRLGGDVPRTGPAGSPQSADILNWRGLQSPCVTAVLRRSRS